MNEIKKNASESFKNYERKMIKEKMDQLLEDIAKSNNKEVQLFDNDGNLVPIVNTENRIEMRSFYTKVGGPHQKTQGDKIQDLHLVRELEEDFARTSDFNDSQARLKEWRADWNLDDANFAESAIAILLHKALGSEYLVMKSAIYDDYINGVDTIIFSKYTGDIVCAFDELFDSEPLFNNDRYKKKIKHIEELELDGDGIDIKYGLTADVVSKQYIRTAVQNIPLICLKVNRDDLYTLFVRIPSVIYTFRLL